MEIHLVRLWKIHKDDSKKTNLCIFLPSREGGDEKGGLEDLAGGNGMCGRGLREVGTRWRDFEVMEGERQSKLHMEDMETTWKAQKHCYLKKRGEISSRMHLLTEDAGLSECSMCAVRSHVSYPCRELQKAATGRAHPPPGRSGCRRAVCQPRAPGSL